MTHWVITGAAGFIGTDLTRRIHATLAPADVLTLTDVGGLVHADPQVRCIEGSLGDAQILERVVGGAVDCVYHLATLPGRGAETNFEAGRKINLDGTIGLLEALRTRSPGARFIFASSVAVYGTPVPGRVDDDTLPTPAMSYAAHKLVGETLVNDYSRRGFIDGLALRLSGILARPPGSVANASAFINDIFHAARDGTRLELPVGPDVTTWLMSRTRCVINLEWAGILPSASLPMRRNWALPALHVRIADLVEALARRFGEHVKTNIAFRPDPAIEAIFHQPPMHADMANALGFRADADLEELLSNVYDHA